MTSSALPARVTKRIGQRPQPGRRHFVFKRVGQYGHSPGSGNRRDGVIQRRPQQGDITRLAATQKPLERHLLAIDMPRQHHPLSKVRATYLRTRGDRHRALQCAGHANAIQLVCDFYRSISARLVQFLEVPHQNRCAWIKTKPDNMNAHSSPLAGEFHTADQFQCRWHRLPDTQVPRYGVVIRDRHAAHAFSCGAVNQITRSQGAIRSGTMCVEVDQGYLYTAPGTSGNLPG